MLYLDIEEFLSTKLKAILKTSSMGIIQETNALDNLEEVELAIKDVNQIVNVKASEEEVSDKSRKEKIQKMLESKNWVNKFSRINDRQGKPPNDPS